jgi:amidase
MAGALPKPAPAKIAPDGLDPWREAFRIVQARETWASYGEFIENNRPKLGPGIKERFAFAATVTEPAVAAARRTRTIAQDQIRRAIQPGTIVALPTAPSIAPLTDAPADALDSFRLRVMRLTCIAGVSGAPQVTIPVGTLKGCPVGLSFIGWEGADETLLDLAAALARHCGPAGQS